MLRSNLIFQVVISERVRARVEDAGRVELNDAETAALVRTKAVHMCLLVLSVLVAVWIHDGIAIGLPFFAFLLGGVAESLVPDAAPAQTCKRIGKAVGAWSLGSLGSLTLFLTAGS